MLLEMNAAPESKWVKEFQEYLINELHVNKTDSIFAVGKLLKTLRKHSNICKQNIESEAVEYMMNTYGANIKAPSQCSPSTMDKYKSYIDGFNNGIKKWSA